MPAEKSFSFFCESLLLTTSDVHRRLQFSELKKFSESIAEIVPHMWILKFELNKCQEKLSSPKEKERKQEEKLCEQKRLVSQAFFSTQYIECQVR